jgi:prevent-host-death family protein
MNKQVTAAELKASLSELLDRAAAGEETLITRHGKPVARLAPIAAEKLQPRKPGRWEGLVTFDDAALWAPITEEELDEIEGNVDAFFPERKPRARKAPGGKAVAGRKRG